MNQALNPRDLSNQMPPKPMHHARTGIAPYDGVGFTVPQNAIAIGKSASGLQMVHHLAGPAKLGLVQFSSRVPQWDSLMVTLTNGGMVRYRGVGETAPIPLRSGNFSFVPANVDALVEFPSTNAVLSLYTPEGRFQDLIEPIAQRPLDLAIGRRNPRVPALIGMIRDELQQPGTCSDLIIGGLTQSLAATLAGLNCEAIRVDAEKIRISPARLQRVQDFIEAQLSGSITLDDLSTVAQLSPFHFSRVFKHATGVSPYHYVSERRLARAAMMLRQQDIPLAELALAVGFSSQAHFTAAFSKAMGLSPGRFRRNFRGRTDFS